MLHAVVGALEDVVLLLLVVCLVPMTILLLGMPFALVVMLLTAIAERM